MIVLVAQSTAMAGSKAATWGGVSDCTEVGLARLGSRSRLGETTSWT